MIRKPNTDHFQKDNYQHNQECVQQHPTDYSITLKISFGSFDLETRYVTVDLREITLLLQLLKLRTLKSDFHIS